MKQQRRTILQEVVHSLKSSRYKSSLGGVGVRLSQGQVVLFGEVKTYFLKQIAQETAMQVLAAPAHLKNEISVDYGSQP